MREIKFRAWHPVILDYYYSDDYCNLADFFEQVVKLGYDDIEMVLEEYTGLKDTNETEIYEGDLITHRSRDGAKPHPVIFSQEKAAWCGVYGLEYQLQASEFNDGIEVVGNIHESPEWWI